MITEFNTILNVSVSHTFYQDKVCKELYFKPTKNTERLLKQFGFKFCTNNGGFILLTSSINLSQLLRYIERTQGVSVFEFKAYSTRSNFRLYTEMPLDETGYFSYLLTSSPKGMNDTQPVFTPDSGNSTILNVEVDFDYLLIGKGEFVIELQARKSTWEYLIIDRKKKGYNDLQIKSNGLPSIPFAKSGLVKLKNGVEALMFSSVEENLELSNYTRYKLDLINSKATASFKISNTTVFRGLPIPRPENIRINDGVDKGVTSMMYVYV